MRIVKVLFEHIGVQVSLTVYLREPGSRRLYISRTLLRSGGEADIAAVVDAVVNASTWEAAKQNLTALEAAL